MAKKKLGQVNDKLLAAMAEMIAGAERHDQGYQGAVKPKRLEVVPIFEDDNGNEWAAEPAELNDEDGDGKKVLFLREYVRVGKKRSNPDLGSLLLRLVPVLVAPGRGPNPAQLLDLLLGGNK